MKRTKLALRLEDTIAARAKANQQHAGGAVPQKSAEAVETREEIAKLAGVSRDTVDIPTSEQLARVRVESRAGEFISPPI